MPIEPDTPTASLRVAAEAHDARAFAACCSPDVVLHSPITDSFVFQGRAALELLMADVFDVFEGIHYVEDEGTAARRTLRATARIGGLAVDEAVLVALDADGLVTEMTLFIRPMPALVAAAAALGPRVARRHGRARSGAVRAMLGPLAFATRRGEKLGARLARPPAP